MKVQVKTLEGCERLLDIKADEKDLQKTEEEVLRDFSEAARIPGFRPGKAPHDLVKRHYAKEIRDQVLKRILPELCERALRESELSWIGTPEISDIHWETPQLSFKAKVEVKPEVPLRRYKGLKASRKGSSVSPEEIQGQLRALQEERAELLPKEGVVEENDFVMCDVEGRVDGKVTEDRKNVLIHVSFQAQKHPEMVKALLGAKGGDLRETEVVLESPGGVLQKACYRLRIHEVKRKELPGMDDAFVQLATPFKTLKELEEAIGKELRIRKERESQRMLERNLLEMLEGSCSFEVPKTLVEEETRHLMEEAHLHLKLLGWPDEAIQKRIAQDRDTLLREAGHRVRHTLILEKIARTEKIEVLPEEIRERISALGARLGRSEKEKEGDLAKPDLRRRIAGEILFEKALAVVVNHAAIQEAA